MKLKIKTRKHNEIPIIALVGDATGREVTKVTENIHALLSTDAQTIVIDCSELDSIDSHGLGMFVYAWKLLNAQNRKLVFLNPSEFIRNLFEGSNLNKVFAIVNTIEEL